MALLAIILFTTSCSSENEPLVPILSNTNLKVGCEGGFYTINIPSQYDISKLLVSSSASWIGLEQNVNSNTSIVRYTVEASSEYNDRTGAISFNYDGRSEILTITQTGKGAILQFSVSEYSSKDTIINAVETKFYKSVKANFKFSVKHPEWMQLTERNESSFGTEIRFKFEPNFGECFREGDIIIYDENSNVADTAHVVQYNYYNSELYIHSNAIYSIKEYFENITPKRIYITGELKSTDFSYLNSLGVEKNGNVTTYKPLSLIDLSEAYFRANDNQIHKDNSISKQLLGMVTRKLVLPKKTVRIEEYAFADLNKGDIRADTIVIPKSNVDLEIQERAFYLSNGRTLVNLIIEREIKTLPSGWLYCPELQKLYLPSSLTDVGTPSTKNLKELHIAATVPPTFKCIKENFSKCTLYVPVGCREINKNKGENSWGAFETIIEE